MNSIDLSESSRTLLANKLRREIESASGRKALEYRSGRFSLAEELRDCLIYLACADKFEAFPDSLKQKAETGDIFLIPDSELGEDCYFGRFHIVYTIFGFRGIRSLVDEIMRLRRLIIKGGKIIVADYTEDSFNDECIKQMKRCGFSDIRTELFSIDGKPAFLITAEK